MQGKSTTGVSMTATYNTVTIGSGDYEVYADVATADSYLEAEVSDAATKWRDGSETDTDAKSRALVSATRLIDKQNWPGTKTDAEYQELEWPRTGTGISTVDEDVVPQKIIDATILLAAEINNGVDVAGSATTFDRVRSQQAGSVSISYFKDLDEGTRFPTQIQELLASLLSGGTNASISGAQVTGADTTSEFSDNYEPSNW